MSLINDNCQ